MNVCWIVDTGIEAEIGVVQEVVFAATEREACNQAALKWPCEAECVEATRVPDWDRFASSGKVPDAAMRGAGWWEGDLGDSCESCGLYVWGSLPESHLCADCYQCRECGCVCEEEET